MSQHFFLRLLDFTPNKLGFVYRRSTISCVIELVSKLLSDVATCRASLWLANRCVMLTKLLTEDAICRQWQTSSLGLREERRPLAVRETVLPS